DYYCSAWDSNLSNHGFF
nr:immunoglobulin light chain junction region [Macaca mulatta]